MRVLKGKLTRHAVFRAFENELIFMFGEIIYQYFRWLNYFLRMPYVVKVKFSFNLFVGISVAIK